MTTLRRIVLVTLVLALGAPSAFGCPNCKYSPFSRPKWGFCMYYEAYGFEYCETIVVDPFSGRTNCDLRGAYCNWGPQSQPGAPIAGNCWTDQDIDTVLLY